MCNVTLRMWPTLHQIGTLVVGCWYFEAKTNLWLAIKPCWTPSVWWDDWWSRHTFPNPIYCTLVVRSHDRHLLRSNNSLLLCDCQLVAKAVACPHVFYIRGNQLMCWIDRNDCSWQTSLKDIPVRWPQFSVYSISIAFAHKFISGICTQTYTLLASFSHRTLISAQ